MYQNQYFSFVKCNKYRIKGWMMIFSFLRILLECILVLMLHYLVNILCLNNNITYFLVQHKHIKCRYNLSWNVLESGGNQFQIEVSFLIAIPLVINKNFVYQPNSDTISSFNNYFPWILCTYDMGSATLTAFCYA